MNSNTSSLPLESFPFMRQPGVSQKQIRTFAELEFVPAEVADAIAGERIVALMLGDTSQPVASPSLSWWIGHGDTMAGGGASLTRPTWSGGALAAGTGCSGCHGSDASPAPPRDLSGNLTSSSPGVART